MTRKADSKNPNAHKPAHQPKPLAVKERSDTLFLTNSQITDKGGWKLFFWVWLGLGVFSVFLASLAVYTPYLGSQVNSLLNIARFLSFLSLFSLACMIVQWWTCSPKRTSFARSALGVLLGTIVGVVAFILSDKYASDLLNLRFSVDPIHFSLTNKVIRFFFFPMYLAKGVLALAIMIALFCSPFVGLKIMFSARTTAEVVKWFGILLAMILTISFSYGTLSREKTYENSSVDQLAFRLDFNDKHKCMNLEANASVVFLYGGKVLVKPEFKKTAEDTYISDCVITDKRR